MTVYLLSEELRHKIPRMGSLRDVPPQDWVAQVRFFDRDSAWRWYAIEYDGEDAFFGLVLAGDHALAGPFSLSELENLRPSKASARDVGVERDSYFEPVSLRELCASEPAVIPLLRELAENPADTGQLETSSQEPEALRRTASRHR